MLEVTRSGVGSSEKCFSGKVRVTIPQRKEKRNMNLTFVKKKDPPLEIIISIPHSTSPDSSWAKDIYFRTSTLAHHIDLDKALKVR